MHNPHPSTIAALFATLIPIAFPHQACARDNETGWFEHSKENAWLHAYDPTLISPRLLSELSYQDLDGGQSLLKLETTLRWAWAIRDDLGFGLQMMIPFDWKDTGTSDETGVGDLEFRTGIVGRISPTLRYGFGVNVEIDSASEPDLGSGALILRPTTALRWDVTNRLNLGIQLEYYFTPRDEGDDDVSALQLKFPLAFKLSDNWSAAISYKPKWNFLTDDDRHRVEAAATHVWGSDHQYALSISTEFPLSDDSLQWKSLIGFAWYF